MTFFFMHDDVSAGASSVYKAKENAVFKGTHTGEGGSESPPSTMHTYFGIMLAMNVGLAMEWPTAPTARRNITKGQPIACNDVN